MKKIRLCHLYERKSAEEGLEQEFNIHSFAQREACAAYVGEPESGELGAAARLAPHLDEEQRGSRVQEPLERPGLQRLLRLDHRPQVSSSRS